MKWTSAHVGQHQQLVTPEAAELQKEAGWLAPGVNPDLHAPEISQPGDESEVNLHGDVEGSPYSTSPGEISLSEAADKAGKPDPQAAVSDDDGTREREVESRGRGVSTEALARDDEADDKPKRASRK